MATRAILQQGKLLVCNLVRTTNRPGLMSPRLTLPCLQLTPRPNTHSSPFHTGRQTLVKGKGGEAITSHETETVQDGGPWMTDLRKRGLYSETRYGYYHKYQIDNFTISEDKKSIVLAWNDGHTSNFDAIWLRHNCHCGQCKHDTNAMGKIEWHSLPLDISLLSVEIEDQKMVVCTWGTSEGKKLHQGAIPTATLRQYCYSTQAINDRRGKRAMRFHEQKVIPQLEYEEMLASDKGIYKCLMGLNEFGICLVKNVPTDYETFIKTVKLLGPLQSSMYGDTFDVHVTSNPINAAYSAEKLLLHMDLPFYETAPGLQILHCIRFDDSTVGGGNTFLDIHEVAHKFREEFPELFDRLSRLPATFNSIHYNRDRPIHMENQKTIFSLNHFGELVSVTWHPMVQGPVELPKEDMMPFYEAYTAFSKMIYTYESMYRSTFTEGDFLVFNNRRVLHGREAFNGGRHLLGAYVELSDYHSYVQGLCNKYGGGALATRPGSHSWF